MWSEEVIDEVFLGFPATVKCFEDLGEANQAYLADASQSTICKRNWYSRASFKKLCNFFEDEKVWNFLSWINVLIVKQFNALTACRGNTQKLFIHSLFIYIDFILFIIAN